jgi:predicted permease
MAVLGGIVGLAMGWGGLQLIQGLGVENLPRGTMVAIDGRVVLFTMLVAVGAGFFFGAIPLVHVFRSDLNSVFRGESRTGTSTRRAALLRGALVTGQVAIAFVLLIGAGLMVASLRSALHVDPGFQPSSVLTGYVSLPESRYPDGDSQRRFIDELLPRLRAIPGVTAVSVSNQIPFDDNNSSSVIIPEGYVPRPGESLLSPLYHRVGPGYFEALGIPLVAGRYFEESDNETAQRVIIIDEWLARRYFPNESPLGKRMVNGVPGMDVDEDDYYTIVGVVGQIKHNDLTESEHVGAYYFTYKQQPIGFLTIVARSAVEPLTLTAPIRAAVTGIDPDLPFYLPQTMEDRIGESLTVRRTPMLLLLIFAAVALFLAAIGIYGVLAYSVTQRMRELGIRIALGGSPAEVFQLVVFQGLRVLGLGLLLGLAGSLLLARLIRALLFGVEPTDPLVLLTVAATLLVVGALASLFPARRATRVDPVIALNTE